MKPYISIDGRQNAPYATVTLQSPNIKIFGDVSHTCISLLDTGSEGTYVPEYLLTDMGLAPSGRSEESVGIGGIATYYPYIVTIVINGETLLGVKVLGWEKPTALIGRNILDSLHVCFDGENFYFR